jgi:hypothetical protein
VTTQQALAGFEQTFRLQPAAESQAPKFWIRRIQVLRELRSEPDALIRNVTLRRGLNIIWAPPDASRKAELFESGVAGHTAGKSTFCRLVRFALGEATFGTEVARKRIRNTFSSGWVVAEIVVLDEPWVVARPLGIGAHSFCLRNSGIEELFGEAERLDYKIFRQRLEEVATSALGQTRFPTGEELEWDHLLPWLTRDQECRFSNFLSWRDSSSESESPATSVAERQFIVRIFLGILSTAEIEEQQANAKLVAEKQRYADSEPLLSHHAQREHARVQRLLGVSLPPPSSDLFGSEVEQELKQRKASVDTQMAALSERDPRTSLQSELEQAISQETRHEIELRQIEERLVLERTTLEQLRARAAGETQTALLSTLPPPVGYCRVPLSTARDLDCPLAFSAPLQLNAKAVERSAADEIQHFSQLVQSLEQQAAESKNAHSHALGATKLARRKLMEAATNHDEALSRLLTERARLAQIESLADDARTAWVKAEDAATNRKNTEAAIEESYDRQEALRKQSRQALQHLSEAFAFVVQALLGKDVDARVDTAGRSLSLVVEQRGERDSAAFATAKLLAFDLAALICGIEGVGHHPRFLLHDGPREADLSPDVYERLFLFARALEEATAPEPSFQYFITTTTAPPEEMRGEPWVVLELSGASPDSRLLRSDL